MTAKEIFELRMQGKIEEAHEAIRPMYKVHKDHYTTLCMFWTAADIFWKRISEGRIDEAGKILEALKRVQPNIDDKDGNAAAFMHNASARLESIINPSSDTVTARTPALTI